MSQDMTKEFRELDESFINFSENSEPVVFHTNDMLIKTTFELPIPVQFAGSTITYSFSTVQGDISFSADFHSADGRPTDIIIEPHRVPSDIENITGRFKAGREGTLIIKFDNSFSWFTPKYLSYVVEMYQPSLAAADAHRSTKCKHLLKALLDETPVLEAELLTTMKTTYAYRAEIVELETQMRQLQLQLESKSSALAHKMAQTLAIENKLEANKDRKLGLCLRTLTRDVLSQVLQYLFSDKASSANTAMVSKYWLRLAQREPLFTRFFGRYEVVFVLGGPGSGKGTNCARIVEEFGYVHLSAGDLLREERQSGSELADMINTYIREGLIVPAEVTVGLLRKAMHASGGNKFLVDGFPRDMDNLACWERDMAAVAEVKFLLFLDCPQEIMLERLLERGKTSGRSDDNRESIVKRFKTYEESTRPIINHFRSLGKIRTVDSNRAPAFVFRDVSLYFK